MLKDRLEEIIDEAKRDVKTDAYSMSIGEVIAMYQNGELILRPEYQRYYRWNSEQKSRLIESLLVGLPLPLFFVFQDKHGKWEVVDGMQRISTILEFVGVLDTVPKHNPLTKLEGDLNYLPDFKDKGWSNLTPRIQLDFKRTKLQFYILLRETTKDVKFEVFQRLNSGGSPISGQEYRNAIFAGNNPDMLKWFETLAENEDFKAVVSLSEREIDIRFDMELVLRFIVFTSEDTNTSRKGGLDVFLTQATRTLSKDKGFNYVEREGKFKKVFSIIHRLAQRMKSNNQITSEKGILQYYGGNIGEGKFSVSLFEVFVFGIYYNINDLPSDESLIERIKNIVKNETFKRYSKSGTNASSRVPRFIELGKEYFKKTDH